jgi:threonine dehydrogenase-like Zn-dependent dehydrogenase
MGMRTGDIPGHEFMGVVEEVGSEVFKLKLGQRVIVGCEFSVFPIWELRCSLHE